MTLAMERPPVDDWWHDDPDPPRVRHLFTAAEAEQQLGIKAVTIRSWFARKRIWHYGIDARGNPMFDRDDLVRLQDHRQTRDQHERARRVSNRARHDRKS